MNFSFLSDVLYLFAQHFFPAREVFGVTVLALTRRPCSARVSVHGQLAGEVAVEGGAETLSLQLHQAQHLRIAAGLTFHGLQQENYECNESSRFPHDFVEKEINDVVRS